MNAPAPSERVPPHDLDAEAAVLSAVLLHGAAALDEIRDVLAPADLFADAHRRILEAALAIDATGSAIDTVTVAGNLKASGRLEQVGGSPYLFRLTDATPSVAHVADHARAVASLARIRRVQALCTAVRAEGYGDVGEADEWLQSVEARMYAACASVRVDDTLQLAGELANAALDAMAAADRGEAPTHIIPTGFRAVDHLIAGWRTGSLYVVGAPPGAGKTALALSSGVAVARKGYAVHFGSLEMTRPQLATRGIAQIGLLDTRELETGNVPNWRDATDAAKLFGELPIAVDDRPAQTLAMFRSSIRRGLARQRARFGEDLKLGLAVFDHLQIGGLDKERGERGDEALGRLVHGLAAVAKEFDCTVLALSQLNREKGRGKNYKLADLLGSGAIEQDAYGVGFLHREENSGTAELIWKKHRQGGSTGTANLAFHPPSTRFSDLADGFEDLDADFDDDSERRFP